VKPSNNAWDFVLGGGLDIPISKSFALRPAQFDFVLTRFNNVQDGKQSEPEQLPLSGRRSSPILKEVQL
jgi:hypothetical protein